jgi:FkbM family methyltransferase
VRVPSPAVERWCRAIVRQYLRSSWPGRTRVIGYLAARLRLLQRMPIDLGDDQTVFLDLRDGMCRDILRDSPYDRHPWEPDEQEVIRRVVRPGDIALDVGAHFGEHAALMASLVGPAGRVVAFEPNPARIPALTRTVTQYGNGEVLPFAVSNTVRDTVLFIPEYHSKASLANWTGEPPGTVHEIQCRQVTIDALVASGAVRQPDFVKCDVEGAELLVFEGARTTFDRRDAPVIMYEANLAAARAFGCTISASTDFLRGLPAPRFSIYWVQPQGTLVPMGDFPPDVEFFNLVAVPAAKLGAPGFPGLASLA